MSGPPAGTLRVPRSQQLRLVQPAPGLRASSSRPLPRSPRPACALQAEGPFVCLQRGHGRGRERSAEAPARQPAGQRGAPTRASGPSGKRERSSQSRGAAAKRGAAETNRSREAEDGLGVAGAARVSGGAGAAAAVLARRGCWEHLGKQGGWEISKAGARVWGAGEETQRFLSEKCHAAGGAAGIQRDAVTGAGERHRLQNNIPGSLQILPACPAKGNGHGRAGSGAGDLRGGGCVFHQGRVGSAGPRSESPLQRRHAGEPSECDLAGTWHWPLLEDRTLG
nr:paraneoplastic antigen Ma6E-like isoform X6 [Caretta caretta]